MIFTTPAAIEAAGSVDAYLDAQEGQDVRPGTGDARLRLWGLKFVLDGGVEAAALEQAQFLGQPATLVPGAPADLVAYPADPFTCPAEQLLELAPAATVVGGQLRYQGQRAGSP